MHKKSDGNEAVEAARRRVAGLPASDHPLLEYWRERHPTDFADEYRALLSLDFELSGVTRGQDCLKLLSGLVDVQGARVLDVGAGNGGLCIACAGVGAKFVAGIEIDEARIALARKWAECRQADCRFLKGRAEELPFGNAVFDIVFLSSVIEHVDSHQRTLAEACRVLKPGGILFLDGPNRLSPHWFRSDPHYRMAGISVLPPSLGRWWVVRVRKVSQAYDVGVFPIFSSLRGLLERTGFDVVRSGHHNYLLEVLKDPKRVKHGLRSKLLAAAESARLLKPAVCVLQNALPSFWIAARKVR